MERKLQYRIKPLKWKKIDNYEVWESSTSYPLRHYKIYYSIKYEKYCIYYFDNERFDSFNEAVEWANQNWIEVIGKYLIKVRL